LVKTYVPEVGDIAWISLDLQSGREQSGRRPVLVLTAAKYNVKTSLLVGCPITSVAKGYPFEVLLSPAGKIVRVVLADQVRSLDWKEREAAFVSRANPQTVRATRALVAVLLGIAPAT
jgi:mRNA interferase MazF